MPPLLRRRAFLFWAAAGILAALLLLVVAAALQAAAGQPHPTGTPPPSAPPLDAAPVGAGGWEMLLALMRVEATEIGTLMLVTFEYVTSIRAWRAKLRRSAVPAPPAAWAREAARQAAWRFWLLFGLLSVVVYANQHSLPALLKVASFTAGGGLVSSSLVNLALDNPVMSHVAQGILRLLKDRGMVFFDEAQAAQSAGIALAVPAGVMAAPDVPLGTPVTVLPVTGAGPVSVQPGDMLVTERAGDALPEPDTSCDPEAPVTDEPDSEAPQSERGASPPPASGEAGINPSPR